MRKTAIVIAFTVLALAGCKGKQDQLTALNAQFDTLNSQYQEDCILAPVKVIQQNQAKCKAEDDNMKPLGAQILQLQADIAAAKR